MSTISLKERMKQLQALKSSVQQKSESTIAREKELAEIASKSPVKAGSAKSKFEIAPGDDSTAGNETQTTAGNETETTSGNETQTTAGDQTQTKTGENESPPTLPSAPPIQEEEDTKEEEEEKEEAQEQEQEQEEGGENHINDQDEHEEVEVFEDVEDDENIEVIEEEVIVEGTEEGVQIEEKEELVVVEDNNEYEQTIETEGEGDVVDEKEFDEYAHGRHPVEPKSSPSEDVAPLDEQAYLERTADTEVSEAAPFDESTSVLPVFAALDADEEMAATEIDTAPAKTRALGDRRESAGLPKGFYKNEDRRWKCIIACFLFIGVCATSALILPFVLDYDTLGVDPTMAPTISPAPTMMPSAKPSAAPTISLAPSASPTSSPTTSPTLSFAPTDLPTQSPTISPTVSPTQSPTEAPTPAMTETPTSSPTPVPTVAPMVAPTNAPVLPPTVAPVVAPTLAPVPSPTVGPTTLRLSNFIEVFCIPISGDEVFEDQSSPQFQAAQYVAEDDPYTSEITDETLLEERYAMVTFYFAAGGSSWSRCNQGDTTCTGEWLNGDLCEWEGITCNGAGRVIAIEFDGVNPVGLGGFIPPEIFVLSLLEDLTIIDEAIGGSLPERFGTDATNVRQLKIQGTQLGGSIPFAYLENSPIESMMLTSNQFGGTIPFEIGSIPTLTDLDLSGNFLIGTLPGGLVRYTSLNVLSVESNLLRGSIPTAIYAMQNLERLHVSSNVLMNGSLLPDISSMESLQGLRVGGTSIGGTLPDELFTLGNIVELDLRDASFEGPLSPSFSALSTLEELSLQGNSFTGTVPVSFGDLTSLVVLNLEGNDLTGSIAPEICQLVTESSLQELTVSCDAVECSCCTECFR